jgi:hypothetical protein
MEEEELQDEDTRVQVRGKATAGTQSHPDHSQHLVLRPRQAPSTAPTQNGPFDSSPFQHAPHERHLWEAPSPYEAINASDVDPFASMAVGLPPSVMAQLMDKSTCEH